MTRSQDRTRVSSMQVAFSVSALRPDLLPSHAISTAHICTHYITASQFLSFLLPRPHPTLLPTLNPNKPPRLDSTSVFWNFVLDPRCHLLQLVTSWPKLLTSQLAWSSAHFSFKAENVQHTSPHNIFNGTHTRCAVDGWCALVSSRKEKRTTLSSACLTIASTRS